MRKLHQRNILLVSRVKFRHRPLQRRNDVSRIRHSCEGLRAKDEGGDRVKSDLQCASTRRKESWQLTGGVLGVFVKPNEP